MRINGGVIMDVPSGALISTIMAVLPKQRQTDDPIELRLKQKKLRRVSSVAIEWARTTESETKVTK